MIGLFQFTASFAITIGAYRTFGLDPTILIIGIQQFLTWAVLTLGAKS